MHFKSSQNCPFLLVLLSLIASTNCCFSQESKNLAIYASKAKLLELEQIEEWASEGEVSVTEGSEEDWENLEIQWPEVTVKLSRSSVSEDTSLPIHLNQFKGYVFNQLAGQKMDAHVFSIITQIGRTKYLYSIQAEPNVKSKLIKEFVSKLAVSEGALVFENSPVLDHKLRVLLGHEKEVDESAVMPSFESAKKRKDRTMKLMATKDLKPLASLPTILAKEQVVLRDAESVARRAICLFALAAEAEMDGDFSATEYLTKHKLTGSLSPEEKAFLANENRTATENSHMTWRFEATWMLLWSLGKVETISFPNKQCDVKKISSILLEDPTALIKDPKLRPPTEVLDQCDLLYRCMWICREERKAGKDPKGLSPSVVYEWFYAMNWLIQHGNADWDDVPTDS